MRGGGLLATALAVACVAAPFTAAPISAQEAGMTPYAEAVEGAARAFAVGTAGDWQYACDNSATCTLLGHADMADPNHVVAGSTRSLAMRVVIGPDGQVITIALIPDRQVTSEDDGTIDWRGPFIIPLSALRIMPLFLPYARTDLWDDSRFTLFRRLLAPEPLAAHDPVSGELRLRLPHAGFAEAMAEIDQRQAAIRRWRRVVQPDDAPVTLRRAVPTMVSGVPPVTAAQMDWCGSGVDAGDLAAFDLGAGWQLWRHDCPAESARALSRWFIVAPGSSAAEVLRLPREYGPAPAPSGASVPHASFEFDQGVLRSFAPALAGAEDCGRTAAWGWTGTQFVLLERRITTACNGLAPPDWLVSWSRIAVVEP